VAISLIIFMMSFHNVMRKLMHLLLPAMWLRSWLLVIMEESL